MKKFTFIIFAVLCTIFCGCSNSNKKLIFNSDGDYLVSSVSDSLLSRDSSFMISFTSDIKEDPSKCFKITPNQKGKWDTVGLRSVIFTPTTPYKGNTSFNVKCDLSKLLGEEVCDKNTSYVHSFITKAETLDLSIDEVATDEEGKFYDVTGTVTTDIEITPKALQKMLKAKIGSKKIDLSVRYDGVGSIHVFNINSVPRGKQTRNLSILWNAKGKGFSSKLKGTKTISIPGFNLFDIINISFSEANKILVSFSDMLEENFPIKSFIKNASMAEDLEVYADDNILEIYSDNNFYPLTEIVLENGIKSLDGKVLADARTVTINTNWQVPYADFSLSGNILPTTQGTTVPVITQNLCGLTVNAYQIYDHNILQFLQVNDLDGNNEIKRVSDIVWSKHFSFDWDDSMQNKKISRGLDISELAKKFPGGMFRLEIRFQKEDAKYVCTKGHRDFSDIKPLPEYDPEKEFSYWDSSDMDWDEYYSFRQNSSDPCHPAFYSTRFHKDISRKKNILLSDLAIMVKKTRDNRIYATVSDIKTARPVQNVNISFYTASQHKIGSGKTDASGTYIFNDTRETKFIVAENKSQVSYLKLEEGTALSVSHFETSGEISENGVKGAIYGERGVWRPGDDIFLTFVLLDADKKLPSDIPVTFELVNALGRTTETRTLKENVNGFYAIKTSTSEDDVTGLWTAKISVGGQTWSKSLRIETVVPNKLDVELTQSTDELQEGIDTKFTLKGQYLHGSPCEYFEADVNVVFNGIANTFQNYEEYSFTNPDTWSLPGRTTLWKGTLDEDSTAKFESSISNKNSLPGKISATLISRIFEPNGNFSVSQKNIIYSPYKSYIGLRTPKGDASRGMLLTDVDHKVDVLLLNPDGSKVSSGSANWALYKLDWKWWWEKDALTNATYVSGKNYKNISSGHIDIKDGSGSFTLRENYPNWGRYLLTVTDNESGHTAGKILYIDWPNWAGRSTENGSGSANMLTVTTDKKNYTTDEKATIVFASGKNQRAHITLERNGKILRQEWIDTKEGTTKWSFDITGDMAPNIYAHVTLLQEHLQTANSLPIRLYGVVPLFVEDKETYLEPVITSKDVFEPNTECTVSVSEKNGKPMTYTIVIVDNGLLNLTNFHANNLHKDFFKKEASSLESWDLYSYVMNAYSGKLETLLSIGGGDDFGDVPDTSVDRFKPVVEYFGPFELKAGEKKATTFEMPAYVGSVRAMVIAGNAKAFGTSEKNITVKSDLMVQSTAPRNIGTNETISIPVTVFNNSDRKENVTLSFKSTGAYETSETLTVEVPSNDKVIRTFTVSPKKPGDAQFEVLAKSTKKTIGEKYDVKIMHRGVELNYITLQEVKPGKTQEIKVNSPFGEDIESLELEVSSLQSICLSKHIDYLIHYPHGCIEQITTAGFGQLMLPDFVDLTPKQITDIQDNVRAVIDKYPQYSANLGGFGYWPGNTNEHPWGSVYAAHFITEARKRGYTVPQGITGPLFAYLESQASAFTRTTNSDSLDVQAYRLYVLALNGKPNLGAMNRLQESVSSSKDAELLLAASYALSGKNDIAKKILSGVSKTIRKARKTGGSFASPLKETALCLFTETLTNGKEIDYYTNEIVKTLSTSTWLSTQELAWALISLEPRYRLETKSPLFTYSCNGETGKDTISSSSVIKKLKPSISNEQSVSVKNEGSFTIYTALRAKGRAIPGTEISENNGLTMYVNYLVDGHKIHPSKIKKGDNITLEVSVYNSTMEKIENIALTVPRPTGIEFANDRVSDEGTRKYAFSYQDFRDDGVYTYFDLDPSQSIILKFNMTSVFDGKYSVPAINARAMYNDDLHAVHAGALID